MKNLPTDFLTLPLTTGYGMPFIRCVLVTSILFSSHSGIFTASTMKKPLCTARPITTTHMFLLFFPARVFHQDAVCIVRSHLVTLRLLLRST